MFGTVNANFVRDTIYILFQCDRNWWCNEGGTYIMWRCRTREDDMRFYYCFSQGELLWFLWYLFVSTSRAREIGSATGICLSRALDLHFYWPHRGWRHYHFNDFNEFSMGATQISDSGLGILNFMCQHISQQRWKCKNNWKCNASKLALKRREIEHFLFPNFPCNLSHTKIAVRQLIFLSNIQFSPRWALQMHIFLHAHHFEFRSSN